jgi:hypothetical protein
MPGMPIEGQFYWQVHKSIQQTMEAEQKFLSIGALDKYRKQLIANMLFG